MTAPAPAGPEPESQSRERESLSRPSRREFVALAGTAAVSAGAGGLAGWLLARRAPAPPVRFVIVPPQGESFLDRESQVLAISREGSHVFFITTDENGEPHLYRRGIDDLALHPVAEGVGEVSVSPDGEWIAAGGPLGIVRIPAGGGEAVPFGPGPADTVPTGPAGVLQGGAWREEDDVVVFGTSGSGGLWKTSPDGGAGEISRLDLTANEGNHAWPHLLPDGNVLFTVIPNGPIGDSRIAWLDMETGDHRVLPISGSNGRYVPTGHIVFATSGGISAVEFNLGRLEARGEPRTLVESVRMSGSGMAAFDLSENGTLVYLTGEESPAGQRIVRVSGDGLLEDPLPFVIDRGRYLAVRASPTANVLAVQEGDAIAGVADIFVYDLDRGGTRRPLVEGSAIDASPLWTPDGQSVVFASNRADGIWGLYLVPANAPAELRQLVLRDDGVRRVTPLGWTPGGLLVFTEGRGDTAEDILYTPLDRPGVPVTVLQAESGERFGSMSPDGRWITYASKRSGGWQVYADRFPELDNPQRVSLDGGSDPLWSRDGRIFFYALDRRTLMAASAAVVGDTLRPGLPERVFEASPLVTPSPPRPYDVDREGRILTALTGTARLGPSRPSELRVVVGWFQELEGRAPAP